MQTCDSTGRRFSCPMLFYDERETIAILDESIVRVEERPNGMPAGKRGGPSAASRIASVVHEMFFNSPTSYKP